MRFFIVLFLSFMAICGVYLATIYMQKPTISSQWVDDVYIKKEAIANRIDTNKMVIVSGSSSLFGIDSSMLSDELNMSVVNFGVNAGVLLPYTLYRAKKVLKSGDKAVLALEYSSYIYDGEPNSQMIDYILARDKRALLELTLKEQFYTIWNITIDRWFSGLSSSERFDLSGGLYGAHNIDEMGDQINSSEANKSDAIVAELDAHRANDYMSDYNNGNNLGFYHLERFIEWCALHDIEVVFIPVPLLYFSEYENQRGFYDSLANNIEKIGSKMIGNPYDFMYSKEWFFNTDYHLTSEARAKHTAKVIELFKN